MPSGLRTAAIDWPATRNATTLDFNLPFFKDQRVFETQTARAVWEELSALGYPMHRQGEWAQLPKRFYKDEMVGSVAAHVARRHEPDLLLVHFLCVDSFQHLYGPRSPEAYWAIEYVDGLIGRLLGSLPAPRRRPHRDVRGVGPRVPALDARDPSERAAPASRRAPDSTPTDR